MARKTTPQSPDAALPDDGEMSVEEETVDAGAPEVKSDESMTLAVTPPTDELYHRRAEHRG